MKSKISTKGVVVSETKQIKEGIFEFEISCEGDIYKLLISEEDLLPLSVGDSVFVSGAFRLRKNPYGLISDIVIGVEDILKIVADNTTPMTTTYESQSNISLEKEKFSQNEIQQEDITPEVVSETISEPVEEDIVEDSNIPEGEEDVIPEYQDEESSTQPTPEPEFHSHENHGSMELNNPQVSSKIEKEHSISGIFNLPDPNNIKIFAESEPSKAKEVKTYSAKPNVPEPTKQVVVDTPVNEVQSETNKQSRKPTRFTADDFNC